MIVFFFSGKTWTELRKLLHLSFLTLYLPLVSPCLTQARAHCRHRGLLLQLHRLPGQTQHAVMHVISDACDARGI